MRRELIEALDFPKQLVLELVEQRNCPHESLFQPADDRCQQCGLNRECHWVSCLNEFADFEGKATYTINASLRYGIDLVGTLHSEARHDQNDCDCEYCAWMRGSQRLTKAFDTRFATNRYRHLY
jgi:hypothetical protein